jgi:hypothetical protein
VQARYDETRHIIACFTSSADGGGKTYILNTFLEAVRSNWGHEVEEDYNEASSGLATASTGVAETLLKLGQTFNGEVALY